jgi:hypothetical protein
MVRGNLLAYTDFYEHSDEHLVYTQTEMLSFSCVWTFQGTFHTPSRKKPVCEIIK